EPTADLRSNIAAEARAKIIYERLIALTDDPGVKEALTFLMTREVSHLRSFDKALYSISPNFPPGKTPPMPEFADAYFNLSQGDGDLQGSWNNEANFRRVDNWEDMPAVDGGDGSASVMLDKNAQEAVAAMASRTA